MDFDMDINIQEVLNQASVSPLDWLAVTPALQRVSNVELQGQRVTCHANNDDARGLMIQLTSVERTLQGSLGTTDS